MSPNRPWPALPVCLLSLYLIEVVVLGMNPVASRAVWLTENLTVIWIPLLLVVLWFRGVRFSNVSYVCMSVLVYLHTIGGHYSFAEVPFDYVTHLFGFTRNHYDRFAHASVGLYAFPIMEYIVSRGLVTHRRVAWLFAVFTIMAVAVSYEWFEWLYAALTDPDAGIAVLGSQGDIWDAQKDMLCDTVGAVVGATAYLWMNRLPIRKR